MASAPLSAGLGGAALALRSCGRAGNGLSLTQPSSAPAAAEAAERFQTCSVPRPARVDDTKSQQRRGGETERSRRAATACQSLPRWKLGKGGRCG